MWKCYSLFFISIETYFDYFDTSKVLKGVGILSLDLNNINFGNNFDEDDSNTNIHIRILAAHIKFEKLKSP